MRLRTKAVAAAGVVPLLLGGATRADGAEAVSATRTFTLDRDGGVECTFFGRSQVQYFDVSGVPSSVVQASTALTAGGPACLEAGFAFVRVRFKRDGESVFDSAVSGGELNDFSANVSLVIEGPVVDVDVTHGANYDCPPRPCEFTFTTNPK
jgi:hypothetical protein